jgi:hypothetical protein
MSILYKPFGIIFGILGGLVARRVFTALWGVVDDREPPEATTEEATWPQVVGAAVLQAAVFAGVRAAVNRWGAKGFAHLTGFWPGEKKPDPA